MAQTAPIVSDFKCQALVEMHFTSKKNHFLQVLSYCKCRIEDWRRFDCFVFIKSLEFFFQQFYLEFMSTFQLIINSHSFRRLKRQYEDKHLLNISIFVEEKTTYLMYLISLRDKLSQLIFYHQTSPFVHFFQKFVTERIVHQVVKNRLTHHLVIPGLEYLNRKYLS